MPNFIQRWIEKIAGRQPARYDRPPWAATIGSADYRDGSAVTFSVLRRLSEWHEPSRACIWKRIRQVQAVEWEIVARPAVAKATAGRQEAGTTTAAVERARAFFSTRGGLGGPGMRFRHFIAQVIEDLLVLDAVALYRRPGADGLPSVEVVDAATIRPLLDERGYRPRPPAPAFEQWVQGRRTGEWTADELRYEMMNPRSCSPYGLSPLECLIATVEGSLRAQSWNLSWFSDSNLPPGMLECPADWTPRQIKEFSEYWDALLSGDPGGGHRLRRTPAGVKFTPFAQRNEMQFERFQQWLLRITCALFDLNPAVLGFAGETYKVAQEGQIEAAKLWGLQPLLGFLKEVFDDILAEDLGAPGLEFRWASLEQPDELRAAQVEETYGTTYFTINEVRRKRGAAPIEGGLGDALFAVTPSGVVELGRVNGDQAIAKELRRWRRKAINDLRRDGRVGEFETDVIPEPMREEIVSSLAGATEVEKVRAAFEGLMECGSLLPL
jgi:hypothetical protein